MVAAFQYERAIVELGGEMFLYYGMTSFVDAGKTTTKPRIEKVVGVISGVFGRCGPKARIDNDVDLVSEKA